MKVAFIFIVFLLSSYGHEITIKVISKLVKDVIRNENIPSILSAITCWKMGENFTFLKSFKIPVQMNSYFHSHHRTNKNVDSANKMWYFIDLRCSESYKFLYKLEAATFAHPHRWILFEPDEKRLTELPFLTDSNILCVNLNRNFSRFDLKQGSLQLFLHYHRVANVEFLFL